jgi:hypothetical protein
MLTMTKTNCILSLVFVLIMSGAIPGAVKGDGRLLKMHRKQGMNGNGMKGKRESDEQGAGKSDTTKASTVGNSTKRQG